MDDLVDNLVEIVLAKDDDFLKVKETLTRIGVSSHKEKKLYQSCHILHKRGKYYIVHFKELFLLDGLESDFDDEDLARRNRIIKLLVEWDLITVTKPEMIEDPIIPINKLKIIKHSEKSEWELCPKYHIGRIR
jgi:hypothetical protein